MYSKYSLSTIESGLESHAVQHAAIDHLQIRGDRHFVRNLPEKGKQVSRLLLSQPLSGTKPSPKDDDLDPGN
jgi:hypothetical protein